MAGRLEPIVDLARRRAAALQSSRADLDAAARAVLPPREWSTALVGDRVAVIAEIKRRSPSQGRIADIPDPAALARSYEQGGASALSVLTEEAHFEGSLDDLRAVARSTTAPVLRKDFIVDPAQVVEARVAGASAVLLIARILGQSLLGELLAAAAEWEVGAMVEVHDAEELDRTLALDPRVVGVNARDLDSFAVDPGCVEALLARVPPEVVAVAESGIRGPDDVRAVARWGADAVLVGTYLAAHHDPESATTALARIARVGRGSGSIT